MPQSRAKLIVHSDSVTPVPVLPVTPVFVSPLLVTPFLVALSLNVVGCGEGRLFENPADSSDAPPRSIMLLDGGAETDSGSAGAQDGSTTADGGAGADGGEPSDSGTPIPGDPNCGTDIEQEELALSNQARANNGVTPELRCDVGMTVVARAHSQDMCDRQFFAHDNPEDMSAGDRLREGGVSLRGWGENILWGSATAMDAHENWMDSPGHRENILRGSFGRIGIGYVDCPGGDRIRRVWTQVFAN